MEKHSYFNFMLFFLAALALSAGTLKAACVLSEKFARKSGVFSKKKEPYAGGFVPVDTTSKSFPVRFATPALLFVLFNAEVLLILPFAGALRLTDGEGGFCALFFACFWAVAYVYTCKRGALDWK